MSGYGFGRRTPAPKQFSWDAVRGRHVMAVGLGWATLMGLLMLVFPQGSHGRAVVDLIATAPAALALIALVLLVVVLVPVALLLRR